MRTRVLTIVLLLCTPASAVAEWQVKPFVGITFGGSTTFVDVEEAVGGANFVYGVSATLIGEVFGLEADLGRAPGFFQSNDRFVLASSATTLTGNFVIAMPRRMTEYMLRPYVVAGAGIMHAQIDSRLGALPVSSTLPAIDVGGGATGFLTDRVGLSWEIRHFRSLGGKGRTNGVSVADERLSFWRANMAVALRY